MFLRLGSCWSMRVLPLRVDRLDDLLVDAPLANRPAPMRALVIPGDQLAIDHEDADLGAVARNHLALAIREFADLPTI